MKGKGEVKCVNECREMEDEERKGGVNKDEITRRGGRSEWAKEGEALLGIS